MQYNSASELRLVPSPSTVSPDLAQCGFLEALSSDPRPAYIVDITDSGGPNHPVYWNAALETFPDLYDSIVRLSDGDAPSVIRWTSFVVKGRWKVFSADPESLAWSEAPTNVVANELASDCINSSVNNISPQLPIRPRPSECHGIRKRTLSNRESPRSKRSSSSVALNRKNTSPASTPKIHSTSAFGKFFAKFDWASTELGDIETWPPQLIEICNLMLASPTPVGVYWTDHAICLYNEAMLPTIGVRHPNALGHRMEEVFHEIWEDNFKLIFEDIVAKRLPSLQYHDRRVGYKDGLLEEVFWDVTFIPVLDDAAEVLGTWGTLYDVSDQEFWRRRIATLLRLTASLSQSDSFDAMWSTLTSTFEAQDRDVPHLLIYTLSERPTSPSISPTSVKCQLSTSFGFNQSASPYQLVDLASEKEGLAPLLQQSQVIDAPMLFEKAKARLEEGFWECFQSEDSDIGCQAIVVVPIHAVHTKGVQAFMIIGLNPYVKYDQGYREFIDLMRRQMSSTLASILLRQEEVSRERLVAEESTYQLDVWKAEAKSHELRFTRLAETAPIGICTYAPDGSKTYANDVWYKMFGMSKDDVHEGPAWWASVIHPDDLLLAHTMLGSLLLERKAVTFEIRAVAPPGYTGTPTPSGHIWILVSGCAEPIGNGPQTVIACFTDISEQKRIEDLQNKRIQDVMDSKRQQEAFIDMTSHEIRNPLSVVLQCGEEIISASTRLLVDLRANGKPVDVEDLDDILDAAETIEFCTLHQKRIVDDILTLSKLDSELLPMTPDIVRPLSIVEGVMKLFEREIRRSEMALKITTHDSFRACKLDQVLLDPSRFSQIVINLVSNAIKFTKAQTVRRLDVVLGGSLDLDLPASDWPVKYLDRQNPSQSNSFDAHWTTSNAAHLHFAILDTGAGMSLAEQETIFSRFTQASPRTHVKYGGSGLGLYICRALSETHGGRIGCKSILGKGSAFGFHIEVGRCLQQQYEATVTSISEPGKMVDLADSANLQQTSTASDVVSPTSIIAAKIQHKLSISESTTFHVLVVEDNVLNQRVLKRQLEKGGHTVAVAQHGQDALDILQQTEAWTAICDDSGNQAFDFIFMDIEMPVMNGLTCTQRIREYEKQGLLRGHVPIIATTGNARDENIGLALSVGIDQVVLKPFSLSTLLPIAQKIKQQYGDSWV